MTAGAAGAVGLISTQSMETMEPIELPYLQHGVLRVRVVAAVPRPAAVPGAGLGPIEGGTCAVSSRVRVVECIGQVVIFAALRCVAGGGRRMRDVKVVA